MSGYADDYKDHQQRAFIERWAPRSEKMPPLTAENLRFNIAHRRAAETELRELKAALATFKAALT